MEGVIEEQYLRARNAFAQADRLDQEKSSTINFHNAICDIQLRIVKLESSIYEIKGLLNGVLSEKEKKTDKQEADKTKKFKKITSI